MAWALASLATVSTRATPSIWAASAATAAGSAPRTTMSMDSGESALAAVTHLAVEALRAPSRCSAMIRTLDMLGSSGPSSFPRMRESMDVLFPRSRERRWGLKQALLFQGSHELGGVLHHDALAALGRRGVMGGLQAFTGLHAQFGERDRLHRLALGLHDVRQLDEARLVQAQVGGYDGGQIDLQGLQAGVDLAGDGGLAVGDLQL